MSEIKIEINNEEIKNLIEEAVSQDAVNVKNKYSNIRLDAEIKDGDGIVFTFRDSSTDEKAFSQALMGIFSLFDPNSKFKLEIDPKKNKLSIPLDFRKMLRISRR